MAKIRNHLGHEERAATGAQQLSGGTPAEIAKQALAVAAAAPHQDWTRAGLASDAMNTPGNTGQVLQKGPY